MDDTQEMQQHVIVGLRRWKAQEMSNVKKEVYNVRETRTPPLCLTAVEGGGRTFGACDI